MKYNRILEYTGHILLAKIAEEEKNSNIITLLSDKIIHFCTQKSILEIMTI